MSQVKGINQELNQIVEESGVEKTTAVALKHNFFPFFENAEIWRKKAESIVVKDINDVATMQLARECRLALRGIRIDADKKRKELKEDSLRYGKAVQGVYNVIEYLIVPIEKHLEEQEKYAEVQEAKRVKEIKEKREAELQPYHEFVPTGIDLQYMHDDDFQKLLNGAKLQKSHKAEQEKLAEDMRKRMEVEKAEADKKAAAEIEKQNKKMEAERKKIAKERADAEAKMEAERKKIAKERADAEAKMEAERKKIAEAKEKQEREAAAQKAKLDIEKRKLEEAEAERKYLEAEKLAAEKKAEADKLAAEKKKEKAPDKEKLTALAHFIASSIPYPTVKSDEAKIIVSQVNGLMEKVVKFITDKTETL